MTSPRVGIVVPVYNAARFLAETLGSIRAQTVTDWRCAIVDDDSRDESAAIAERFVAGDARFRFQRQPANGGVGRARTSGAGVVGDADFLIFLDADDAWRPDALATLLAALDATPAAPAAHAAASFIDADGRALDTPTLRGRLARRVLRDGRIADVSPPEPTSAAMLATWPCVITPGVVLIRRAAWAAGGGWDLSLSIGEDWELWYRLSLIAPLAFVDAPLIRYRVHATSSSSTWRRPLRLRQARRKVFDAGTLDQRRFARQAFRATSRQLGVGRMRDGLGALARLDVRGGAKGVLAGAINLAMSLR